MSLGFGLQYWGWFFLALYIGLMIVLGAVGMKRVTSSDDFATARRSYGPIFLAFALTATTASGGTFIGIPALAYSTGFSALWYAFIYPLGVYLGVLLCLKAVRRAGDTFGNRSIPEFLGDRYDSEALRVCVSLFSILLLFYLAGQLLSGAVMFNQMMGVDIAPALAITGFIIMFYIVIGGAHADILTDGVQGALMLILALAVAWMFWEGFGVVGGFNGMIHELEVQDPALTKPLSSTHPVLDSKWDVVALFVAHIPLGLLPHVGNKLWALKNDKDQTTFIVVSFVFGMILPCIALGGLLARAILGDSLLLEGSSANYAIPELFVRTMPTWLAAMIGAGVLAAIMSTADGLLVSISQIFANDIYRRSIAPRLGHDVKDEKVDRIALLISRLATVVIVVAATYLAWRAQEMNVALLIAAGIGGMLAAISGPIFAGILWKGTTKAGALSGLATGAGSFVFLQMGIIGNFSNYLDYFSWAEWLLVQEANPFSCGAIGVFISLTTVVIVSFFTEAPSSEHLSRTFGRLGA